MTTEQTIECNAGRTDLAPGEFAALASARKSERLAREARTERTHRDGWTVEITHELLGHWSAGAWREDYESEMCLYLGDSEADCRAAVERLFVSADLGSLDPLDVGFDLRVQGTPVQLPKNRANVTVRTARSKKHPEGKSITGTTYAVARQLVQCGYSYRIA